MIELVQDILPILRKASIAILGVYSDQSNFNTTVKSDDSPLTLADTLSNDIIREGLLKLDQQARIISEESRHESFEVRSKWETYFLVDPLDGTKEFIRRNGEFTINIAIMQGSRPRAGFVFVPVSGIAYVAEKGKGAFRIDQNDRMTELITQPFYLKQSGIKIVASRSHRDVETEMMVSNFFEPEIVSVGSSLKFLMIAEGKAHFYPRLAPTMEWDTAAAQCVLEEAGGSVLQYPALTPLVYNKENLLNPSFLAVGSLLDPEMLYDIIMRG